MKTKTLQLFVSLLIAAALLLISCAPKAAPTPAPAPTPAVPAPVAPTPVTPAPGAPVPVADKANMIEVTLRKLDGSTTKRSVEKPKYGGILNLRSTSDFIWDIKKMNVGTPGDILTMDKLLLGDYSRGTAGTGEISWQIYEYFSMDHFMPALAESWEMPGQDTIIYHLRRGVRWALDAKEASKLTGGRELVADDVVFSLKWMLFNEPKSLIGASFGGTKNADIIAVDKYTVSVKAPKQDLYQFLGFMSDILPIFPPEVVQKYGGVTSWEHNVGSGPFMVRDFVSGSVTTLVKNPNYWGHDPILGKDYPLPYVDSMKYFNIPDDSTAEAAFRTGRLDGTLTLTKEKWESLQKTAPHLKAKIVKFGTGSNKVALQMRDPKAPWQDIRVRRALMLAINHPEIIKTFYGGAADPQAFPLPGAPEFQAMGWSVPLKDLPREVQELYEYNPDKAKALLAEAGYPSGFKTSLMINAGSQEWRDLSAILKEYWAKIGVDVSLDYRESAVYTGNMRAGNFPGMTHDSMWGVAAQYIAFEPGSYRNVGGVTDPKMQNLRVQMFDVFWDMKKRTPIMRELYEYTMSQVWYLTIPSAWNYKAYQPWLKNYDAEASVGYFGKPWPYVWLDLDLKKSLGY